MSALTKFHLCQLDAPSYKHQLGLDKQDFIDRESKSIHHAPFSHICMQAHVLRTISASVDFCFFFQSSSLVL